MRKIVLTGMLCLCGIAIKSYAQPSAKVGLGIKGGLNVSTVSIDVNDSDLNTDSRVSYHAGIFGLLKIDRFGIQPEIVFSRQGADFKFDNATYESIYDYVNVPILLKFYLLMGLNIQVGPQFGFIVGAQRDRLNASTGEIFKEDIKEEFATADIGLNAGLGWDLPFGLSVDVRYNIGFTNAIKESSVLPDEQNYVLQASIGYRIVKFGND